MEVDEVDLTASAVAYEVCEVLQLSTGSLALLRERDISVHGDVEMQRDKLRMHALRGNEPSRRVRQDALCSRMALSRFCKQ